jgi:NAD(P)-dependent dehydrogenase (short-subunit alcohol dehydrogenase family)
MTMRDMSGKVILITGATRGIGRMAAHGIAPTGATIVVVGRDQARVDTLISELQPIAGCGPLHGEVCDLTDQADVRALSDRFKTRFDRLDVLVNNAGAIFTKKVNTVDGYERTWALNHNAYFLLTTLLQDILRSTGDARVVSTASDAHRPGKMHWDDLQFERRGTKAGWSTYCQSKLANILFTRELSRRLDGSGVTANCLHPGFVNTGFSRNNGSMARLLMTISRPFQRKDTKGAETVVWLAVSEEAEGLTGEYCHNCKPAKPTGRARNNEDAARLWGLSEEMTGTVGAWR